MNFRGNLKPFWVTINPVHFGRFCTLGHFFPEMNQNEPDIPLYCKGWVILIVIPNKLKVTAPAHQVKMHDT